MIGNLGADIREPINYEYFLELYEKYIDPVADTYAWCLMPNHFHFLVRMKEKDEVNAAYTPDRVPNPVRGEETNKIGTASLQLSKLFNSYAQAFNKRYNRHGSLFERPFKRKQVTHEKYLRQLILYIHNNPVHHGFCEHAVEYPWSSYLTCVSVKSTKLHRDTVVGWFDDVANFKYVHNKEVNIESIEEFLKI